MTADTITAIKKALEAAEQFIVNGVELGYIRMPDPEVPDSAHQTLPMIRQALSTLESLQRENEDLRNADLPQSPWPASGWAMDRIKELEKALKPFAEVADFMDSETTGFSMTDTLHLQTHDEVLPPFLVDVFCLERFYTARTALSSTGDTHGN